MLSAARPTRTAVATRSPSRVHAPGRIDRRGAGTPSAGARRAVGRPARTALAAAIALLLSGTAAAQWTVVDLHPAGAFYSEARGVENGLVVGRAQVNGFDQACTWTSNAASFVNINPVGSDDSQAYVVCGGQVSGWARVASNTHAALFGPLGTWTDLHPAGASYSEVRACDGGQQGGSARFGTVTKAVLWSGSATGYADLHPNPGGPGSTYSVIEDISAGQQVGTTNSGGINLASLWTGTAASWVNLTPAAATGAEAFGAGNGAQVGRALVGGKNHASLWHGNAASWIDLNPNSSVTSAAYDVDQGEQVGEVIYFGFQLRAALWAGSAGSLVDLNALLPPEFTGSEALSIWHDGNGTTYIAGWGQSSVTGTHHALLWINGTVPSPWTDLGSGLAGAGGVPQLAGAGTLVAGSAGSLSLSGAAASEAAVLFQSTASTPTSFKGGTLVPVPVTSVLLLTTSPAGDVPLAWPSFPSGLSGLDLYFQYAVQDAGAVHGVALSNALKAHVP